MCAPCGRIGRLYSFVMSCIWQVIFAIPAIIVFRNATGVFYFVIVVAAAALGIVFAVAGTFLGCLAGLRVLTNILIGLFVLIELTILGFSIWIAYTFIDPLVKGWDSQCPYPVLEHNDTTMNCDTLYGWYIGGSVCTLILCLCTFWVMSGAYYIMEPLASSSSSDSAGRAKKDDDQHASQRSSTADDVHGIQDGKPLTDEEQPFLKE